MDLFLGMDGGGTRTRVVVVDLEGRVLGRGESGIGNIHHAKTTEVAAHLAEAIASAVQPTRQPPSAIRSAFLGMAGATGEETRSVYRNLIRSAGLSDAIIEVDHDIRIALAGGLAGRPGIALIVGTGSSCYGRTSEGRTWQTGGWGMLVADEGSGYDIGRRAMIAAVRMADGRMPASPLQDRVFAWLKVKQISEILARLYETGIERDEIAAFAPEVVRLAEHGDLAALQILESGAVELAEMVGANHAHLATADRPEVVVTGGLGTAPTLYREMIKQEIERRLPEARVREMELEPVCGAALLAMNAAQLETTASRIDHLRLGLA
ncbi:MAG: hypothetical protein IT581_00455 [Verrucomicrobiales bacterium]|nr:hypothetical protein [Verrucomicrobiales bacterium]